MAKNQDPEAPARLDILEAVADAGVALLSAGAEVARVEDTMVRIGDGLGMESVETAVFPTAIILSSPSGTLMRRVRQRSVNLAVVAAVNQLSRDVAILSMTLPQFLERLKAARATRRYSWLQTVVTAAIAGGLLSQLVGGRWYDFFPAMAAGALAYTVRQAQSSLGGSFQDFLAAVAAVVPGLIAAQWPIFQPGTIIVGGIMVLVPGLAITSAIRDGMSGDVVSSVARTMEAVLTAGAVAAGVALPLNLYLAMGGHWH